MLKKTLSALSLAVLAMSAQAHQIWLEPAGADKAVVLRFGEFGDNLREASPGLLDNFGKPQGVLINAKGEEKAAAGNKTANGFALPFTIQEGVSIVAEDASYPLSKFKRDGKDVTSWYHPAARLVTGFAAQKPKLTLDLTPTGKDGEFKATFKGQPLAKTQVAVVTQSGWMKEGHTDAQGLVQFDLPWQGQYVAEIKHNDRNPGERAGEKYDGVSYVTSVTYVKPEGVAPVAAGPAAAPNPAK